MVFKLCAKDYAGIAVKLTLLSVVAFVCVAATVASADTITFNFASTINSTSPTASYTSNGVTIKATGTADLFYKMGGGDETGLGLNNDPDHEIAVAQSITLDLSSLFSKNVTSLTLMLGSIQSGESASVCDANNMCITFGSSDDDKAVSILSLYADMLSHHSGQLTISGITGDVLVDELQATTAVPEPSTLLLFGSGILMMVAGVRKRMR
jgi:hypothetical protein